MERPSGYLKLQYYKWQNNVFVILKMKKNALEASKYFILYGILQLKCEKSF